MRRKAVVATSVVAMLVLGAVLATTGGAQGQQGQTLKFVTKGGKFSFVDHKPRAKRNEDLGAGDQFMISTPAFSGAKRAGTLDATCTATLGGKNGRGICQGVYTLPSGDIYISARLTPSDTVRGAVTGGTRAFTGARGTFTSVDRPGEKGGDPSDDTITLLP